MAVINADGFIGRIVEVGRHAARVLLVTDLNSRIPVQLAATGLRALLSGTNGRRMRLTYVLPNVTVSVGALIVTSGHGGVLPRGIPVGRVDSVNRDIILVRPLVNWNRLTFVRRYRLPDSPGWSKTGWSKTGWSDGLVEDGPGDLERRQVGRWPETP